MTIPKTLERCMETRKKPNNGTMGKAKSRKVLPQSLTRSTELLMIGMSGMQKMEKIHDTPDSIRKAFMFAGLHLQGVPFVSENVMGQSIILLCVSIMTADFSSRCMDYFPQT